MYAVSKEGAFGGYADSVVSIRLHENGSYVPCTDIDVAHAGTLDDPIPAARGMEYEYGKYYLDGEDSKIYLCQRTGEAAGGTIVLQYIPHELIGNYFTAV